MTTSEELPDSRHAVLDGQSGRDCASELDWMGVPTDLHGKRVLDIGCSDGGHTFACEDRGASVVAIDSQESLRHDGQNNFLFNARKLQSSASYESISLSEASLKMSGEFDLVLFLNVLYHVEDAGKSIAEAFSLVAPGGKIFVKTLVFSRLPTRFQHWLPARWGLRTRPRLHGPGPHAKDDHKTFNRPSPSFVPSTLAELGAVELDVKRCIDRQYTACKKLG